MRKSKSKTFHKGDDVIPEILDFVISQIETTDYTPEGTAGYIDGLSPHDPRQDLNFNYTITVTKHETT